MKGHLSERQVKLAEEVVADLHVYLGIITDKKGLDPFQELLRDWAAVLCVLAWEMLDSVIVLARAGRIRAAYALSRSLIDYAVRLKFYIEDAKIKRADWERTGAATSIEEAANATEARGDLGPNDEAASNAGGLAVEQMSRMLPHLNPDAAFRARIASAWSRRTAYLQADNVAIAEIGGAFADADDGPFGPMFSEAGVVATSLQFALMFMEFVGEASTVQYAFAKLGRDFTEVFGS
jgi:hypothetical protein